MKIFEGLSNSENMVFNVRKLLNIGVDLMLQQGANRSDPADLAADLGCC
jgi:hypothetical protein